MTIVSFDPMRRTDPSVLIRKHHHDTWTHVSKDITEGRTGLSLRATGLLCHLIGKPDSWKTWSRQLAKQWRCSRTVILNILNELRAVGYAQLSFERDAQGRMCGKFWCISDEPEFKPGAAPESPASAQGSSRTDGLLSRTSEKSEHRKSSPIQNTDFWTNRIRKTEEGGDAPPSPSLLRPLFKAYAEAYKGTYGRRYRATISDASAKLAVESVDPVVWNQLVDWVFSNGVENKDAKGTITNLHSFNSQRRWEYLVTHLVEVRREWRAAWRTEGRRVPNLDGSAPKTKTRSKADVEAAFAEADAKRAAYYAPARMQPNPTQTEDRSRPALRDRLRNSDPSLPK